MAERLRVIQQMNHIIGPDDPDALGEVGKGISLILPDIEGQVHSRVSIIRSEDGLMHLHVAYMDNEGFLAKIQTSHNE